MAGAPIRIVVLVGTRGRGSNMQTIIDACASGEIHGEVVGVIGTGNESPALARAAHQQIPTQVVEYRSENPEEFGDQMHEAILSFRPDLVLLGGFLRKLSSRTVSEFHGRIMNTHPALIPAFCGKGMYGHHVHQAVLDYGVKISGCTVHFVDEGYDTGPIIMQAAVPVEPDDIVETLSARVLKEEHRIFKECVRHFAAGRLRVEGRKVRIEKG